MIERFASCDLGGYFSFWRAPKAKLYQEDEGHHPTLGAHAKFTNYAFNVDEFMRLIYKAADAVKDNREKLRHF